MDNFDSGKRGLCVGEALVSVIIPAYNRVRYIQQAVDSVLGQTYSPIELIVVDDGSTDGTYELLKEYGDKLQLITHPNRDNKGQSAAINLGMKYATGKYLAILDSDDFWALNKLEVVIPFLEKNPDVGLVYSNGYGVSRDGEILYEFLPRDHQETNDPNRVLLDCYTLLPNNSVVRKDVIDRVGGFEETFRAAQDHDMLIRLAENTKFAYLPDYLFYYRRHSDSISAKNALARWRNGFEILRRAMERYPYKKSTIRKRRAVLNYRLGEAYFKAGSKVRALPYFLLAGILDPIRSIKVLAGL